MAAVACDPCLLLSKTQDRRYQLFALPLKMLNENLNSSCFWYVIGSGSKTSSALRRWKKATSSSYRDCYVFNAAQGILAWPYHCQTLEVKVRRGLCFCLSVCCVHCPIVDKNIGKVTGQLTDWLVRLIEVSTAHAGRLSFSLFQKAPTKLNVRTRQKTIPKHRTCTIPQKQWTMPSEPSWLRSCLWLLFSPCQCILPILPDHQRKPPNKSRILVNESIIHGTIRNAYRHYNRQEEFQQ